MSHRNRSAIFTVALIAWLFSTGSLVQGQSPTQRDPTLAQSTTTPSLRKFAFKNTKAADALNIQARLSVGDPESVAVDERGNTLIYRADDQKAREIEEFYTFLDAEPQSPVVRGDDMRVSAGDGSKSQCPGTWP